MRTKDLEMKMNEYCFLFKNGKKYQRLCMKQKSFHYARFWVGE